MDDPSASIKVQASQYLDWVQQILAGLSKIRAEKGGWFDSEVEKGESLAFKIGESLRPFYLASRLDPSRFDAKNILDKAVLTDTSTFFRLVQKNGFFPSPYSPIPASKDQYTDFAAFVLEFCRLVYDYWRAQAPRQGHILGAATKMGKRALTFLIDPAHRVADGAGCRWAGTTEHTRQRKAKAAQFFTDTFFTSQVILSLHGCLNWPPLELTPNQEKDLRDLTREAGKWIAGRFDGTFITGDEKKFKRQLLYSTWGLRALVETYSDQDQATRGAIPTIANAYIGAVNEALKSDELAASQEYMTILSADVDAPLYYEDRTGLGGVLLALASLQTVPQLGRLLEETSYSFVLERLISKILSLRHPTTGLWYADGPILSIHSHLVQGFLALHAGGKEITRKTEVSGPMVRHAVKEALLDETVISTVQRAVYDRLLRLAEERPKERAFGKDLESVLQKHPSPTPPGRGPSLPRATRTRTKGERP